MEKKIEYYTIKPNLKQLFGRKVTKELEFDEYTDKKNVHQVMKNCVLTTTIKNTDERKYGNLGNVTINEETKIVQTIPEGVILIWSEENGYIIPDIQMTTLDELIEEAKTIQRIYEGDANEIKRDKN